MRRLIGFSFLAVLAHFGLSYGWVWLDELIDPIAANGSAQVPLWYSYLQSPVLSAIAVAPGLALGFFARERGFLLGALCGVLAGPLEMWLVVDRWGDWQFSSETIALIVSSAIANAIIFSVAAGCGELLARREGSNNSFKPKPLRGSA